MYCAKKMMIIIIIGITEMILNGRLDNVFFLIFSFHLINKSDIIQPTTTKNKMTSLSMLGTIYIDYVKRKTNNRGRKQPSLYGHDIIMNSTTTTKIDAKNLNFSFWSICCISFSILTIDMGTKFEF